MGLNPNDSQQRNDKAEKKRSFATVFAKRHCRRCKTCRVAGTSQTTLLVMSGHRIGALRGGRKLTGAMKTVWWGHDSAIKIFK